MNGDNLFNTFWKLRKIVNPKESVFQDEINRVYEFFDGQFFLGVFPHLDAGS